MNQQPFFKEHCQKGVLSYLVCMMSPIYRLIEVADEVQFHPDICRIIEESCVVSRSGIYEQHQGLDAIMEEVNKTLKR